MSTSAAEPDPSALAGSAVQPPGTARTSHHHGNLRAALIDAGIAMLDTGESFSLRAVARRVGVSQAAPYRHFASKQDVESAMAVHGFRRLRTDLETTVRDGEPGELFVDLALTYIHFAEAHPALYGLMFGQQHSDDVERQEACADVFALIQQVATATHPERDPHGLATAGWALAHGLATLHLERALDAADGIDLDTRVRAAFAAIVCG